MEYLDTIFRWISSALNKVGAYVVLPIMTGIMTLDVTLRYVFNAPLSWGLEVTKYLLLVMFALGMLEAFRSGAHIRMDLLYRQMSTSVKRLVTIGYATVATGVFATLAYKSAEESLFQKNINEVTQYLHMPRWLFSGLVSAMAALIVVFFILRLILVLRGTRAAVEDGIGHFGEHE